MTATYLNHLRAIGEAERDAERYRWLKENAVRIQITTETQMFSLYGKDLDAVIDTASGTDAAHGGQEKK